MPSQAPRDDLAFPVGPTYDRVARKYAQSYFDELTRKPFDRDLLDRYADRVRDAGLVCDIGCGPGHVARYLHDRGIQACGIDLSPEMVKLATELNPGMEFSQGDMLDLPLESGMLAGITCFYALIHLTRAGVPRALAEYHRVLRPGGVVLIAVHGGTGEVHSENWFDEAVSVDATLFGAGELTEALGAADFRVDEVLERPPYDFEYQSQRLYLLASQPRA